MIIECHIQEEYKGLTRSIDCDVFYNNGEDEFYDVIGLDLFLGYRLFPGLKITGEMNVES